MIKQNSNYIKQLVLAALFLALGLVLPTFTMQIKEIGDTLLPMHLPVMLCGLLCGWQYGLGIGLAVPILRSLIFSMPPLYPNAIWMALELATYGFVIAIMYKNLKINRVLRIYISLITAQLAGRIVWGISKAALLGVGGKPFTFEMFFLGGFIDSGLGIVLQIIIIPTVIIIIDKSKR